MKECKNRKEKDRRAIYYLFYIECAEVRNLVALSKWENRLYSKKIYARFARKK